jgi:hypothetical protein
MKEADFKAEEFWREAIGTEKERFIAAFKKGIKYGAEMTMDELSTASKRTPDAPSVSQDIIDALKECVEAFGDAEKWEPFISRGHIFDEIDGDHVYAWDGDAPLSHTMLAKEVLKRLTDSPTDARCPCGKPEFHEDRCWRTSVSSSTTQERK